MAESEDLTMNKIRNLFIEMQKNESFVYVDDIHKCLCKSLGLRTRADAQKNIIAITSLFEKHVIITNQIFFNVVQLFICEMQNLCLICFV